MSSLPNPDAELLPQDFALTVLNKISNQIIFKVSEARGQVLTKIMLDAITTSVVEAEQRGREQAAGVLRKWASHYPTDIFPEDGQILDCQSAAFARHLCREIEKDIHALGAIPVPGHPAHAGEP